MIIWVAVQYRCVPGWDAYPIDLMMKSNYLRLADVQLSGL